MAADVGGIPEAMMGVPYLLPVRPIEQVRNAPRRADGPGGRGPAAGHRPLARGAGATARATARTTQEIARASRAAALAYAGGSARRPLRKRAARRRCRARSDARRDARAARPRPNPLRREAETARPACSARKPTPAAGSRASTKPPADVSSASLTPAAAPRPRLACGLGRRAGAPARPRIAPRRGSLRAHGAAVDALADAIDPYLDRPFAFFGHSMGAVVAFELARELRRRGAPLAARS